MEGLFHPYFRAGAVTHVELGAAEPKASALAEFLIRAFKETTNNQIIFSPEFTVCAHCDMISRGLLQQCPHCGTDQVDGLARISSISAAYRDGTGVSGPSSATGTATKTISPPETAPVRTEPREFNHPASLDRVRIDSYISANFGA